MPEYKLTYFDVEGRAEQIRLLFVVAGVEFEDVRLSYTVGQPGVIPPALKQNLPYGQIPVLEFGDTILSQSGTIGRFLARRFNLMGSNELEAAKIEELLDGFNDYMQSYKAIRMAKTEETKEAAKKNLVEVTTPKCCKKFSEILEQNGTGFYVGKSLSLADITIAHFLNQFTLLVPDLIKDYPALSGHIEMVRTIPRIQEWIQKHSK